MPADSRRRSVMHEPLPMQSIEGGAHGIPTEPQPITELAHGMGATRHDQRPKYVTVRQDAIGQKLQGHANQRL
jgi:hypothetical protein